ncbi:MULTISPECIES: 2Fe-2S iron-sulfur cluster binding domain-containing protein [Pseudomonas]|jgi:ferredoxin|uniref:2Fe-2S iron-sulfur cluster binding domain-containing protein n=1 Tax=Pseudomonas TaxID=286 RepID=UPI00164830E7|nr:MULTISPECIES: 2Fe-2S iron-sulfur cluster-binding protein [Pseudomonas]MDZ3828312.1 2Fe-2S iron-sulfur cluster-binding protein [Pseudomonas monsensis]QXH99839.1 (2Fe-2S)-binding protein [Pseudomonas monsensis]
MEGFHTLTVTSTTANKIEFELPTNAPFTDIEYERDGKNIIPLGCRIGACGACLIRITSGFEAVSPRDDDEEAFIEVLGYSGEEYRLACQCLLKGKVAIEIIG